MKWTSASRLEGALCDSWTDVVLAAFKDAEQELNQTPADLLSALTASPVVLKVGDFASFRHQRECVLCRVARSQ